MSEVSTYLRVPQDSVFIIPKYKSTLAIADGFSIDFTSEKPNAWFRFFQYVLLGFKWKDKEVNYEK